MAPFIFLGVVACRVKPPGAGINARFFFLPPFTGEAASTSEPKGAVGAHLNLTFRGGVPPNFSLARLDPATQPARAQARERQNRNSTSGQADADKKAYYTLPLREGRKAQLFGEGSYFVGKGIHPPPKMLLLFSPSLQGRGKEGS